MEKYRIIHITHSDLDAVGCDLVVRMYSETAGMTPEDDVLTYFCNVTGATKQAFDLMNAIKNGDIDVPEFIFITDIAITEACASNLEEFCRENNICLMHVDHHPTDKLNKKFKWSTVLSDEPLVSATEIIFGIFKNDFKQFLPESNFKKFESICMDISRYDTWRWKREATDYHEEDFNICCRFYGFADYVDHLKGVIYANSEIFDHTDRLIVKNFKDKRDFEVSRFISDPSNIYFTEQDGMTFAYLMYAGDYINSILEAVYLRYPDIDIVAGFMPITRLITYRSNKPNIDCGEYAKKKFGGGGHKSAAGANFIDIDVYCNLLKDFYHAVENQKKAKKNNSFRTN